MKNTQVVFCLLAFTFLFFNTSFSQSANCTKVKGEISEIRTMMDGDASLDYTNFILERLKPNESCFTKEEFEDLTNFVNNYRGIPSKTEGTSSRPTVNGKSHAGSRKTSASAVRKKTRSKTRTQETSGSGLTESSRPKSETKRSNGSVTLGSPKDRSKDDEGGDERYLGNDGIEVSGEVRGEKGEVRGEVSNGSHPGEYKLVGLPLLRTEILSTRDICKQNLEEEASRLSNAEVMERIEACVAEQNFNKFAFIPRAELSIVNWAIPQLNLRVSESQYYKIEDEIRSDCKKELEERAKGMSNDEVMKAIDDCAATKLDRAFHVGTIRL